MIFYNNTIIGDLFGFSESSNITKNINNYEGIASRVNGYIQYIDQISQRDTDPSQNTNFLQNPQKHHQEKISTSLNKNDYSHRQTIDQDDETDKLLRLINIDRYMIDGNRDFDTIKEDPDDLIFKNPIPSFHIDQNGNKIKGNDRKSINSDVSPGSSLSEKNPCCAPGAKSTKTVNQKNVIIGSDDNTKHIDHHPAIQTQSKDSIWYYIFKAF